MSTLHPVFQAALAPFMPPAQRVFDEEAFFKEVAAAMQQVKLDRADGQKLANDLLAREVRIRNLLGDVL